MSHPQLTITIQQVDGDTYLATVARAKGKEVSRNSFTFKSGQLIDIEPQWMLNKAIPRSVGNAPRGDEAATAQAVKVAELASYGQRLYKFLFGDGVKFNNFLEFDPNYAKETRITLAMHENAAALWQLPWEYLHDGDDFLALHGRFKLSRRPFGLDELEINPVQLPLRILVVVSSPEGAMLLDTEEEIGVIQDALDEARREGRVEVQYLDDATLGNIGDSLREFNPHVLHAWRI